MKRLVLGLGILSILACSLGKDDDAEEDTEEEEDVETDSFEGDEGGECKDDLDNDGDGSVDCDDVDGCSDASVCQDTGSGDTGDSGSACSGTAPVIVDAYVVQFGMYDFEGGEAPGISVYAEVTDADADLDRVTVSLRWDTSVDGTVSATGDGGVEVGPFRVGDAASCTAPAATVGTLLEVGADLSYSTQYEFAIIISDAAGLESDEAIVVATTPDSSGNL